MHMISDFTILILSRLDRKKNAIWKVDGYNIRSVYALSTDCVWLMPLDFKQIIIYFFTIWFLQLLECEQAFI